MAYHLKYFIPGLILSATLTVNAQVKPLKGNDSTVRNNKAVRDNTTLIKEKKTTDTLKNDTATNKGKNYEKRFRKDKIYLKPKNEKKNNQNNSNN